MKINKIIIAIAVLVPPITKTMEHNNPFEETDPEILELEYQIIQKKQEIDLLQEQSENIAHAISTIAVSKLANELEFETFTNNILGATTPPDATSVQPSASPYYFQPTPDGNTLANSMTTAAAPTANFQDPLQPSLVHLLTESQSTTKNKATQECIHFQCTKKFNTITERIQHEASNHKVFPCFYCVGKPEVPYCNNASALRTHYRTVHSLTRRDPIPKEKYSKK